MVANVVINPEGFYDQEALGKLLGLKPVRITKAINAGELRSSERAGKRFIRGQWAIAWLEGSEAAQS